MRLLDLEPRSYAMPYREPGQPDSVGTVHMRTVHPPARTRSEVKGIMFVCPVCLVLNDYDRRGVHSHLCWQPDVPADFVPGPGRWWVLGETFADCTLKGQSSDSVLSKGLGCHFFVRAGRIEFAMGEGWHGGRLR